MKFCDLTGKRFGRLTVIKRVYINGNHNTHWLCKCDCGNETVVESNHLKRGDTKSCGCLTKKRSTTHGFSKTRLYSIYYKMKERTINEHDTAYQYYGGRGIKVCDEWINDFKAFYEWAIDNGYKDGLTIDRIDTNGNYEPSNCRWSTRKEQANNRRTNKNISYNGETHNLKQWSEKLGINYGTLKARINRYHWTIERAFKQ